MTDSALHVLPREKISKDHAAEARAKLQEWLEAWEHQSWGKMAFITQCTPGRTEGQVCVQIQTRLSGYPLTGFAIGDVKEGFISETASGSVGFADFSVVADIRGSRHGILLRAVLVEKGKWFVNFLSLNRRFKPDRS
jgi:hypothetical protein